MAEGDMVMVRGRFSGHGQPTPWIVVDTLRVRDGVPVEQWDVVEDEVSREDSVSGLPVFGDTFPGDH
jgi:predicted SnoaL-like aldol condensation-catalyzing enzyme